MRADVGGIEVLEKTFAGGHAEPWHLHEASHGCLMLAGAVEEQKAGRRIELGRGDCSWRPPDSRHRFRCGVTGVRVLTFEIPDALLDDLADGGLRTDVHRRERSGTVMALGQRLRAAIGLGESASHFEVEALLLDLLTEAARAFDDDSDGTPPAWLVRVRDRLHDELDRPLTLAELADDAGVHRVHLARSFRRCFGRPLGAYHRRLRLDRALRDVVDSDTSLAEIAHAAGFADQSHFTNLVTRVVGLSPGRLRALSRAP